jgi:hypothetical protein
MAQQIIDVGTAPNDGSGDPIRTSFQKSNENFTELYNWINSQRYVSIANTLFVAVNGDDNNSGINPEHPLRTIEKALELANSRKAADPTAITLIDVGPGRYMTRGHLDMPDDSIIRAVHRTSIIYPESGFEERNQFRMGSGCFIEGFLFEGWRVDDLDNPTEGFAVSFRPGAVIRRVPYAHKIAIRTVPTWGYVPPPTNPYLGNPLVPRGAGVVLADGLVCSQYSIFPNIMTWGATPVTANGIGYCAKNGGLINAVNAVSIWAHKHFYALSGGQIILSACSTQFGDFTLVSKGTRNIVYPTGVTGVSLSLQPLAAAAIDAAKATIVDNMWTALVSDGYTAGWTTQDEFYTRRDAANFLQCVSWVLQSADETPMENFSKGFFNTIGVSVIDADKLGAFLAAWRNMRDQMNSLPGVGPGAQDIITALVVALESTVQTPTIRIQPSTITAIGHTWTGVLAGVALTKIPPVFNRSNLEASILEQDSGVVIASGQDDQGSALFVGGMKINSDTGELSGPPFESAVGRIATRSAIAFSGF